jgi:hypothetical protein
MCARPDVNLTPSVEEFVGWYNIQAARDDGFPVLRSVEPLPEFEHGEFFKLYAEAEQWFGQLVLAPPNGPFDPLAEPPFFVRSDADDRTLEIDADFRLLDLSLLSRIQKEFLGRYPLWRVILIAEHPSCSIVVYPSAVRFGSRPVDVDADEALRELVPRHLALREARERPRREHISQMQRLLPAAVRAIGERTFCVCGVLDNYEGDERRLTICLLILGNEDDAFDVQGPPGADVNFLCKGSGFGVSADGTIISHIEIPHNAAFCLVPWLPPANYRGPLTIIERVTGKRHHYELKSEDIMRTSKEG